MVSVILDNLAEGLTTEEIVRDYPPLTGGRSCGTGLCRRPRRGRRIGAFAMSAFLLKLDENLAQSHVDFLNGASYSAECVMDEGLSGAEDAVVWHQAVAEGRFFITLDLDFADAAPFPTR